MKRESITRRPVATRLLCYEQPKMKQSVTFGDFFRFIFTGPFHTAKVMDRRNDDLVPKATFLVVYENGERGPETVATDTTRYYELLNLTDRYEKI